MLSLGGSMDNYQKTGYLKEDFRYFHLTTEKKAPRFTYHYHDFHKVLLFLGGKVSYWVEGRSFDLLPGDIVLVPAGELHCPVLWEDTSYERIILYLSPDFLSSLTDGTDTLDLCFTRAARHQSNVIRLPSPYGHRLSAICTQIEEELQRQQRSSRLFGGDLYRNTLVTQLLILLNRGSENQGSIFLQDTSQNPRILQILEFIGTHLAEDLSIDRIASQFYISRYHLMHMFKDATGYTVGNYVTLKRLLYARSLIEKGTPVIQACYLCGYQNYSSFSRAYKKHFQESARRTSGCP